MYQKEIVYDRETKDFRMELDGEFIGFARTYHEAEVTLDGIVFDLLSGNADARAEADAIEADDEFDLPTWSGMLDEALGL